MMGTAWIQSGVRAGLQSVLQAVYPPHCLACNAIVGSEGGLCGDCWRETPFISGLVCDLCGMPLPGDEAEEDDEDAIHCDDCLRIARPWRRGRAALAYRGTARRLVLAFKHGDRTHLATPAARWMAHAGRDLFQCAPLLVPVPLHWRRLIGRRYNQSALLALALARETGLEACPDLLQRIRSTGTQDGKGFDGRFANVESAIQVRPAVQSLAENRAILLIDDVMTSGASLAACAEACHAAGATDVQVLALARVCKDG